MFKIGDKVKCVEPSGLPGMVRDRVYTIHRAKGESGDPNFIQLVELIQHLPFHSLSVGRFVPATDKQAEQDPSGLAAAAPGAKLDAGKVMAAQILAQFPRALHGVAEVGSFGARKYSMGGWQHVDNGFARYEDAQFRHFLKRNMGEAVDPDSKLDHLKHEAWNALAKLELYLRDKEAK